MRQEDVEPQYHALVKEFREVTNRLKEDNRRLTALASILNGYLQLFPELRGTAGTDAPAELRSVQIPVGKVTIGGGTVTIGGVEVSASGLVDDRAPRGREAVRRVLMEEPRRWYKVDEMVAELDRRGWTPEATNPAPAVRTALQRLAATDPAVKKATNKLGRVGWGYWPEGAEKPKSVTA
jgi:hypothetical protein